MRGFYIFFLVLFSISCTNYYRYSTYSESGNPFMVVEIPAGTNLKYEYDPEENKFKHDERDGIPREISYLAYPGNYGFIPSTLMEESSGGDGDPLDAILIGSTLKKGTIVEFKPVGVLRLLDNGEQDDKIIGVIVNSKAQTIDCATFKCLQEEYPGIKEIFETWFKNYDVDSMEVEGWGDEKEALAIIEKWIIN